MDRGRREIEEMKRSERRRRTRRGEGRDIPLMIEEELDDNRQDGLIDGIVRFRLTSGDKWSLTEFIGKIPIELRCTKEKSTKRGGGRGEEGVK